MTVSGWRALSAAKGVAGGIRTPFGVPQSVPPRFGKLHRILVRGSQDRLLREEKTMIRKLKSGEYRLYSKKKDPRTGKRRNLGTFSSRDAAEKHERCVQYVKRHC